MTTRRNPRLNPIASLLHAARLPALAWSLAALLLTLAPTPAEATPKTTNGGKARPAATAAAGKPGTARPRASAAKAAPTGKATRAGTVRSAAAGTAVARNGRKTAARTAGPTVINMPSPPAAQLAPVEPATVRTGCVGPADAAPLGYSAMQIQAWFGGPPDTGSTSGIVPACRRYAAVSVPGPGSEPATLALLAFGGTRALLVTRPVEGQPQEPAQRWIEIDPDANGMRELWLPPSPTPANLESVPASLHNELLLLVRAMSKQSGAPAGALVRVWLQDRRDDDEQVPTLQALELVDPYSGQAYDSAVWLPRGDTGGAYISSHGAEYERVLWQAPVDHLRVSRGVGASSMLVHRRSVVKTRTKKGKTRTKVVVKAFRYNSQHVGIDFAAPTGTPVVAVADGEIEVASWRGGYGNLILVRHGDELSTYYGHLSAYAPGIQPGVRVRRGQVIGLVGSTGFSTGPHLHFEIRKDGRYIDPTRPDVQLPAWTLQPEEHAALLSRLLQLEQTRQRNLPGAVQPAS